MRPYNWIWQRVKKIPMGQIEIVYLDKILLKAKRLTSGGMVKMPDILKKKPGILTGL